MDQKKIIIIKTRLFLKAPKKVFCFSCIKLNLIKKKLHSLDIIFTVKEFSSNYFYVKQNKKTILLNVMTGSYTRSNRTWKTYLHILFCLSSMFICSVFVSFEVSLWKGLGTKTDKQIWWKTFQEVILVHLPKTHNCSSD